MGMSSLLLEMSVFGYVCVCVLLTAKHTPFIELCEQIVLNSICTSMMVYISNTPMEL